MRKVIIVLAIAATFISCKKSDIEISIEQMDAEITVYKLRQAKLSYLKDLIEIRDDISLKERKRLVDSIFNEEKLKLKNDSN